MPYAQVSEVIYLTSPRQLGFLQYAGEDRQVLASPRPGRALRALPADQPSVLVVDAQMYGDHELQRLIGVVRRYRPFTMVIVVCPSAEPERAEREARLRQTGAQVVLMGYEDWLQRDWIDQFKRNQSDLAAAS